ncbi:helitron helicase-like domain-containing protein [Nocardia arthritidis]|uniref:Replication initiator protein n=1 Tax=Nocardia arthritidis TaxID=228602 RepID=A0A6G9Y847_9NOCA|nr:helitron helicase-like domain-containing protein [Nocardia arthritidis]QIS09392.1 replication initiator protein [Nocardia arthritidis]
MSAPNTEDGRTETLVSGPAAPARQTAAERRALPNLYEIAQAAAEKYEVCQRPIPMRVEDPRTGTVTYEAAPCKSTIESVCPACAKANRALRIAQCREGWHLEAEPDSDKNDPTPAQLELLTARADLADQYRQALADQDNDLAESIRQRVMELDRELRETGLRGRLPALDATGKDRRRRSTRRRQDVPNLPRRKVAKTTVGKVFAGRFQPSMFVTLTMPSYGRIHRDNIVDATGKPCSDGSPVNPDSYDYTTAARDIVFFSKLVDRWIQNLRRAVGWDVQYFATVEPQKRGAPHLHILIRGAISREILRQVTAATYHQVWWPHFNPDNRVYSGAHQPVWDHKRATFVDPDSGRPLTYWDDALDVLDSIDNLTPAHTVRFGEQMDRKHITGVLAGTEKAGRTIGYVTKYLVKSISEIVEPQSDQAAEHYDRLHAELRHVPCSPRCAVWLEYGIVPQGATDKTVPGRCKGKAHRRDTLGLPGRRVLVSRRWSNKTLPDHKADRAEFVRQLLAAVGIEKPDTSHLKVTPVEPGDKSRPLREHLIMGAIAKRTVWRAEYLRARLAADPPEPPETSAIPTAA